MNEKINDRKIKIEVINLNCLVENINNPGSGAKELMFKLGKCTKSFAK
jgi:hypothetical protein